MIIVKSLQYFWKTNPKNKKNSYLGEDIVTSYSIKDDKSKLVELINFFKNNGLSLIYEPPFDIKDTVKQPKLRKEAASLLISAAKKLPNGHKFKLSEGYRPLTYQIKIFTEIYDNMKKKYPKASRRKLWEETTKYVADPNLCPPHTTGGAVDITIVDKNNNEIDMGTSLNSVDDKSNTFFPKLSKLQMENRKLLFDALTSVGFVNLPSEWWHYSYGDQYWAIYYKKPYAIYGKVDN